MKNTAICTYINEIWLFLLTMGVMVETSFVLLSVVIAFVDAASDLVDDVVPEVVKVVVAVVMNLEIAPVVVLDFVIVIVDFVVDIVDSVTVVIDCVVVVVDFLFNIVDSMVEADCMAKHPRSKNKQINLIMEEFTLQGLFCL